MAAPEHSLWPIATEMSACQDTWRRKETRRKNKTKQNNPCPRRGKEHTELPDRGHTRSEDILRPTLQGQEAGVLLLCSRETATCPETPTHWPLVSFFFFLSFSFSYPSHQFSMLKKKFFTKKKNLKLMRQAPGLAFPPGGLSPTGHGSRGQPGTTRALSTAGSPGLLRSSRGEGEALNAGSIP